MKNNFPKIVFTVALALFIIPQVTFAAWWNPFTWNIFNAKKVPTQQVQTSTTTTAAQATSTVSTGFSTSIVASTTKIVNKPTTINKPNEASPKVASPKYPLFSASTEAFFTTPNLTTLKEVCEQAKSVPTGDTKKVLSEDKLTMQEVPYTLHDQFKEMCDLIDRNDITFANATPNAFYLTLANDDSDSVRIAKLKSNDFMKIPNSYAVFYLYSADSQEKKYINSDLSVNCPPKNDERVIATDKATHKIYAPVIYLLSELSRDANNSNKYGGLGEKGKSRLSKVGVGWEQNIPFYGICLK